MSNRIARGRHQATHIEPNEGSSQDASEHVPQHNHDHNNTRYDVPTLALQTTTTTSVAWPTVAVPSDRRSLAAERGCAGDWPVWWRESGSGFRIQNLKSQMAMR